MTSEKAGLYVHVPFCRSKCPYCSFVSFADPDPIPELVDGLEREIERRRDPEFEADTVHLGGGTPTLLSVPDVARILKALARAFSVDPEAEITLEANPRTVNDETLQAFRELGVNRLTLGAQSFDEADLAFLGRIHGPRDTVQAFESAREAGFENLALDLIHGLPGRGPAHWIEQVDAALALEPEHLSCYALTLEAGTPLEERFRKGSFELPTEEMARRNLEGIHRHLESRGYPAYEVSNFSRAGRYPSLHNSKYWTHAPYLGFGPSAHSFLPPLRSWNPESLSGYLESALGEAPAALGEERLTPSQLALETLALSLRTTWGVDLPRIEETVPGFLEKNAPVMDRLEGAGLVRREGAWLRPTLEGLLLADALPLVFEV